VSAWFQAVANGVVEASTTSTDAGCDRGRAREHDDDADARQHAQCMERVGQAPEDRDDEIDAPVGAQVFEHGGEAVAVVGTDGGERVDHVVARIAAGAEHLACAGDDLDPSAQAHQTRRTDAAASTATSNDSASCARQHVEHDCGARSPPRFVLADHELGAGRRLPVRTAQVVAQLVVAQGDELVAEIAHHRATRRLRARR
jgi:hypothetical protein